MSYNEQLPAEQHIPVLERGQIVPAFALPGADGMPHGPWDYKQREHLLLLFVQNALTTEGHGLLRTFAEQYQAFREEQCAILAVTAAPVVSNLQAQEALHLPFALLADPSGGVIARYTRWEATSRTMQPCIVLANRYGAVYQQWVATDEAVLPPVNELLEALSYLNRLCTP